VVCVTHSTHAQSTKKLRRDSIGDKRGDGHRRCQRIRRPDPRSIHLGAPDAGLTAYGGLAGFGAFVRGFGLDEALRHRGWRVADGRLARLEGAVVNRETIAFYGPGLSPPTVDGRRPAGAGWRRVRSLSPVVVSSLNGTPGLAVTDRDVPGLPPSWVLARPRRLVVGLGCTLDAVECEVEDAVTGCLAEAGLSRDGVRLIATVDRRRAHPAVGALAARLGVEIEAYGAEALRQVDVPNPSAPVQAAVGTPSVAEAAALLASRGRLLQAKVVRGKVTVAIAEASAALGRRA